MNIPDTTVPAPIPDATLGQIVQKFVELETLLAPYMRSLSDDARKQLAKMGPDSVEFVQNGQSAINYSIDFMPRDFDPIEFKNALALAIQLAPLVTRAESLARGLDDGDMLFGSIAYTDALEIYALLAPASKKDSALLAFYNAMKARFDKLRGKRVKPPV